MTERHPQNSQHNLQTARLQWQDGEPLSTVFGDVYFSRDNGLAETRHVFLDGNRLPERWRTLPPQHRFTIMETGFGTGLNFLCAAKLWLETAPKDAVLYFVSVEKYPLTPEDLRQALSPWTELHPLREELIALYPPLVSGFHRLWLFDNRVCLTLIFDDAVAGFEALCSSDHPDFEQSGNPVTDAWFLDGFAPSKNPDLWSPPLFSLIARLSQAGTSASTFTVARLVRDGLQGAGFSFNKLPGYGRKREMLVAEKTSPAVTESNPEVAKQRCEPPWYLNLNSAPATREVTVIGGGIAGCSTAAALAKRGLKVTLVERHGQLGAEASGNPQGILYPKLSLEDLALSLYARQAVCHAISLYQPLFDQGEFGEQCGVLALPESDKDKARFPFIAERYHSANLVQLVSAEQLTALSGVSLASEAGLFFPRLGWLRPANVCQQLAQGIARVTAEVNSLVYDEQRRQWQLMDSANSVIIESPAIVLANGYGAGQFTQTGHLPLRQIRGQITSLPQTQSSSALRTVICGAGYVAPASNGIHTLGATYGLDDDRTDVRADDHRENLHSLGLTDPALAALFGDPDTDRLDGRAAVRCTTRDYLPIAGPAPRFDAFTATYAELRRNARTEIPHPGSYWPGLWLNCGHGSRGLTYAPLAAELVASQLNGDPWPLPRDLANALSPARFIIRNMKRNII